MPALFIGRGNPMNAIDDNEFHRAWQAKAKRLPRPGSNMMLAVPTPEHYLPLLYAIAIQEKDEALGFFNSTLLSSISTTSVLIGDILNEGGDA